MKRFELLDNERIISEEGIHWKNYIMPFFLLCICTFSLIFRAYFPGVSLINRVAGESLIPSAYQPWLSAAEIGVLAILAVIAVINMIRVSYIRYYLTDKRVIAVSGIIAISFQEMLLERVETVYLNQNAYERIYSCGDILCVAPGSQVYLDDVRNAVAFKQKILSMISTRNG